MKNKKKKDKRTSRDEFRELWNQMVKTQKQGWKEEIQDPEPIELEEAVESGSEKEKTEPLETPIPEIPSSDAETSQETASKPVRKPLPKLDTPGLTREQKLWIGIRTIVWAMCPLLLYLFVPTLFMMIGMTIRRWNGGTDAFIMASGNFYDTFGILGCFLILKYLCEKRGESFSDAATFYWKNPDWNKIGNYIVLGISMSIFLSALLTIIPLFDGYAAEAGRVFQRTDLILVVCSIVLIAPLSEETIFRGLMFNRLLTQFSERTAVLITAAVFAACHVNLVWIVYAFFMGVLLCWVSLKEDNIFYAIVLHSAFNAPTMLNVIIGQFAGAQKLFYGNQLFIFCYGVLALGVLILWIRRNEEFVSEFTRQFLRRKE